MIKEDIKKLFSRTIQAIFSNLGLEAFEIMVEKPQNQEFGDYAVGVFGLAKKVGQPPEETAKLLAKELDKIKPPQIAGIKSAGGYVNFFLSEGFLRQELASIYKNRKSYGKTNIGKGQKVIVEYSQPNIAKQMHIGHLRTTILGNTLAGIFNSLGYKVTRWNYLGDWGTQFGKLIAAYKLWGNKKDVEISPMVILTELYVRFHRELKEHPELERRGREEFNKLERGDKENRKLWEWFRKLSLKEFEAVYKLLDIKFDTFIGESYFEKELGPLVADLQKRGIAEVGEEGAIIIKLDKLNLPPALIRKADGASLYLTRDLALLKHRIKKYKPTKILHVVGNEQTLHFQQLSAIAEILGLLKPEHVKYGLVLGEDKKKMATREGESIPLREVINKTESLAWDIVEKKNFNLSEKNKSQIAKTVALGALKYEMLKEHRNSDIVFSWERMLDFSGNSAPYLQYTYARLASILAKAGGINKTNLVDLTEPSEFAIIKHLLEYPDTITDSSRTYSVNNLCLYLYELANLANRFYEVSPILKDSDIGRRNARLILIETVSSVLKSGLGLLGIKVLERI